MFLSLLRSVALPSPLSPAARWTMTSVRRRSCRLLRTCPARARGSSRSTSPLCSHVRSSPLFIIVAGLLVLHTSRPQFFFGFSFESLVLKSMTFFFAVYHKTHERVAASPWAPGKSAGTWQRGR
jgi:hypothetical protein